MSHANNLLAKSLKHVLYGPTDLHAYDKRSHIIGQASAINISSILVLKALKIQSSKAPEPIRFTEQ